MKKLIGFILVLCLSGLADAANGDAPGGKVVSIKSDDVSIFGILYDESNNKQGKKPD